MKTLATLLVLTSLWTLHAHADELDFLSFGGEGEFYLPVPVENAGQDADRLRVQSVELTTLADFDDWLPGFDGKLTYGAQDAAGDLTLNIREAYVDVTDVLTRGLDLRVGKFFLPFGLLNQTRRSAWAFPTPPRFWPLFLNDGGVADTGVDLAYAAGPFSIRVGATNGFRFDNAVQNGGTRPLTPTNFARPEIAFRVGEHTLAFALDYLARVDNSGDTMRLAGLDLQFVPNDDDVDAWSGQLEAFHRFQNPASEGLAIEEELGGYVFAQKKFGAKFSGGLRADFYQNPSLTNQAGQNRKNLTYALCPVFAYTGRDHLRLEAAYTYLKEARDGDATHMEQTFEFRLITEFGDIPKFRTPTRDRSWL